MKRAPTLAALALVAACRSHDAPPSGTPAGTATPTPHTRTDARPAAPTPPPIDARSAAAVTADANAFITAWLDAQNRGDLAAYQALYDPHFTGVRRSGTQVAHLDRDGWMRERARMLAHPMTVAADGASAVAARDRVFVTFTQSFEQGSYHDTGRKLLVLAQRGADLRIVHEELLASTLLPPTTAAATPRAHGSGVAFGLGGAAAAASMQLALVEDGKLLLGRTDDDFGPSPLEVEHHGSPAGGGDHLVVTRDLGGAMPPPSLAPAVGLALVLLDDRGNVACDATIKSIDGLRAVGDEATELLVWSQEPHVVMASLDAPDACRSSAQFARPAALPDLTFADLPPDADPRRGELAFGAPGGATVFYLTTKVVDDDDCNTDQEHSTSVMRARRTAGVLHTDDAWTGTVDSEALDGAVALDVDGDGQADLVTTTGVFPGAANGRYDDWWPRLTWDMPRGLGCDGE